MPNTAAENRAQIQMELAERLGRLNRKPLVELYDSNWETFIPLVGETQADWLKKRNDTGEGNLVIFGNKDIRQHLVDELGEWEDLHVRVRHGFYEWTGKAEYVEHESDEEGFEFINVKFVHEFEHAKKMVVYCNPWFPAELQYPKLWAVAMPSVSGLTTTFFLNLLRRFGLPWTFSDNLFNPSTWLANLNPANWPIVVVPKQLLFDTSMWSILTSRMGNFYDMAIPTMKDAGVTMNVYRWFPGMPQPAASHYTLTKPTLVVDFVDDSGYVGPTGTLVDGFLQLVSRVADDFINEVVEETSYVDPPEYSIDGYLGTSRTVPHVFFRSAQTTNGISALQRWKMRRYKATGSSIVTGGHSPDYINAGLKLLLNGVLGYLGQLIGNPGLALGIFDSQVEDVVLAFHRVHNPARAAKMGLRGPPFGEVWESTGGTGFSLSALQAIRSGFYRSRAYTTFEVVVRAGAPYWPDGHFRNGNRVICEIGESGVLYTEHVESMGLSWDRPSDPEYRVGIGNQQVEDQPGAILSRQIAQIRNISQAIGVSS